MISTAITLLPANVALIDYEFSKRRFIRAANASDSQR